MTGFKAVGVEIAKGFHLPHCRFRLYVLILWSQVVVNKRVNLSRIACFEGAEMVYSLKNDCVYVKARYLLK